MPKLAPISVLSSNAWLKDSNAWLTHVHDIPNRF